MRRVHYTTAAYKTQKEQGKYYDYGKSTLALSVVWGGSFFFSKVALAELQPFTVVFGRVGLAALVLHLLTRTMGQNMPSNISTWGLFFVIGALNNLIPFSLIFWGQTQIESSLAAILNATTPVWTVLFAHFLTRDEKLTVNRLGGVLCGLLGVVIMIGPDALQGLGLQVIAQLAVIGATISYAFAGIFGKRFKGVPPLVTATGQVTATACMMLPIVLLVDQPWLQSSPGLNTWGALLGLAILSTAIAYVIYFRLLSTVGATNLLLVTFLIPVSALLLGVFILGERLDLRDFGGMAFIGFGLALIDGRLLTALSPFLRRRSDAHIVDDYQI
ncbi:MAG: DMT family transporter [Caldilinea sp. CFX5]|nr:DMT family transporter [Caldilinea sp. CFX5]